MQRSLYPYTSTFHYSTCSTCIECEQYALLQETRDQLMEEQHSLYPHYAFDKNRGYASDEHKAALAKHGFSPIHLRNTAARDHVPKQAAALRRVQP